MSTKEETRLLRRRRIFSIMLIVGAVMTGILFLSTSLEDAQLPPAVVLIVWGIVALLASTAGGAGAIFTEYSLAGVRGRNEGRRAEIARVIAEHEASGAYEIAEHQTSEVIQKIFEETK